MPVLGQLYLERGNRSIIRLVDYYRLAVLATNSMLIT